MKRLGILGGTFDPIHLAHLRAAEEIGQELNLEKVYLIPCAFPPHKTKDPVTPFHHRMAMARLAVGDSVLLEASDLEGKRSGPSYSIETLREFHTIIRSDPDLFFIVGMDVFLDIKTWKEYNTLFDYAHFVIIQRAGYKTEKFEPLLSNLCKGIKKTQRSDVFIMPSGKSLILTLPTSMDISSTHIRKSVTEGKSIRFLVPESVKEYILKKGLYKDNADFRQSEVVSQDY